MTTSSKKLHYCIEYSESILFIWQILDKLLPLLGSSWKKLLLSLLYIVNYFLILAQEINKVLTDWLTYKIHSVSNIVTITIIIDLNNSKIASYALKRKAFRLLAIFKAFELTN